jgi:hypothetical protein
MLATTSFLGILPFVWHRSKNSNKAPSQPRSSANQKALSGVSLEGRNNPLNNLGGNQMDNTTQSHTGKDDKSFDDGTKLPGTLPVGG